MIWRSGRKIDAHRGRTPVLATKDGAVGSTSDYNDVGGRRGRSPSQEITNAHKQAG